MTLVWYVACGDKGLMAWTAIATITANIEVLILIRAFGLEQTLGNVLFASTFLVTDILSELSGKKQANKAVNIGILTSVTFIIISQSWFLYKPSSESEAIVNSIHTIFSNTPRLMLVSFAVYAIVQKLDVILYHKWWDFTTKMFSNSRKGLWIRNNFATLTSQLINTVLFTFGAFLGKYELKTLFSIILSSYIIFICTTLMDTPFVYIARALKEKGLTNKF